MHTRALSIGTEHGVTHITEEKQNANISNETLTTGQYEL